MNRCDDRHALDTAHVEERTSRHCLAASCAMALHVLFELDRAATEVVVQTGLAAMSGGATFGNARVLLARAFGIRSEVVSGDISSMLELSGRSGVVVLGVNPSKLYEGAAPGRHAILLTSSSASAMPGWARGLIDTATASAPRSVTFIDASRGACAKQLTTLADLGTAFDAAGREALLITPVRVQRLVDDVMARLVGGAELLEEPSRWALGLQSATRSLAGGMDTRVATNEGTAREHCRRARIGGRSTARATGLVGADPSATFECRVEARTLLLCRRIDAPGPDLIGRTP